MFTNIYNNDKELVISLRNRERLAFKYLYLHYTKSIKQFVVNNGGQPGDAEDIEQKVIIHLYEKIVSEEFILNENTKLSTYMFAVGKNMWFKKLGRSSHELSEEHINDHIDEFDLNDETDADKIEAEVIKALQNSDSDCKTILTMYYYDKKSMREIAESLGTISEDNLRKRKYKCIQKLKKVLMDKIKTNG